MKNQPLLIVLIVLLVVASFLAGTFYTRVQNLEKLAGATNNTAKITPSPAGQARPTPSNLTGDALGKISDGAWSKGSKEAKVTIVEFSDFECPFCGRYSTQTYPQIDKEYIQTGKVRYMFRHFPLPFHTNAQKASEATECAGEQGKFWEMHDKLFADQSKLAVADIKKTAASIAGLKTANFNSCLDSGKYKDKVASDLKLGQEVGVTGTPAFYINGRPVSGALPFDNFKTIIEEELKK